MTTTATPTTTELAGKKCKECEGGTPPLNQEEIDRLRSSVPDWSLEDGKLTRDIQLKNFKAAVELVNRIGSVAEEEGHHPDLLIHRWNHVKVMLYTHSIEGLSENDFIMAAKIGQLL